jgi:hypothetical protein
MTVTMMTFSLREPMWPKCGAAIAMAFGDKMLAGDKRQSGFLGGSRIREGTDHMQMDRM